MQQLVGHLVAAANVTAPHFFSGLVMRGFSFAASEATMPSIIAELGHVIEKHLQFIGLIRKVELDDLLGRDPVVGEWTAERLARG